MITDPIIQSLIGADNGTEFIIDGTILKKIDEKICFMGFAENATDAEIHNGISIQRKARPSDSLKSASLSEGTIILRGKLFKNCTELSSVNISDTLIMIEKEAFSNCINLESIQLPNSLILLMNRCFQGCSKLKRITIPQSVQSIGPDCFAYSGIESIAFDTTKIRIIEKKTFYSCINLKEILIPEEVIVIGESAFERCTHLETVHFSNKTKIIGPFCFADCVSLIEIDIPDSIDMIGDCAFFNCINLKVVSLPDKHIKIGKNPFKGCNNVKITIRNSKISSYDDDEINNPSTTCDENCQMIVDSNQDTLIWSDQIDTIPPHFFKNNRILKIIDIPKNVTTIGAEAFQGCYNIQTIIIRGNPTIEKDAFSLGDEYHKAECILFSTNRIPIKPTYKNMFTAIFNKCDPNLKKSSHKPNKDVHDVSRNNENVCPKCGRSLKILPGNYGGWFKACPDLYCGYTTNVSTPINKGMSDSKLKRKQ